MLKTSIGGIALDCCVYNASGPRTNSKNLLVAIGESRAGAVLCKSATLEERKGNPHPRYLETEHGSINSEGLPNKGIDYYVDSAVVDAVVATGKPYILSLSGLSLKNNLAMLDKAKGIEGISAIELNLACPNVPGKPTMAYDFDQMDEVLAAVCEHPACQERPLGVKLAPYFDMPHFDRAAAIVNKYKISFVVCTNTIGNAMLVDAETEEACIAPKGGYGGLGGGYIKQTALANVRAMRERLKDSIDVVGVGGVSNGVDAFELILCGASAVQVGTKHYKEGPVCFTRIAGELEDLMRRKNYSSIEDFRGKLKPFSARKAKPTPTATPPAKKSSSSATNVIVLLQAVFIAVLITLVDKSKLDQLLARFM